MTRINTIDVALLADAHLMAEYRELPMVHGSLRRTLNSSKGFQLSKVPPNYTLNSGHVYFWYNKRKYLHERFNQLVDELLFRGFDVKPQDRSIDWSVFDSVPQIEWYPTAKDHTTNVERIILRISQKPNFYRWTKRNVPVYHKMF